MPLPALLLALSKAKGKGSASTDDEESEPEVDSGGDDYKALAKSAAKDGDFDAMIDALCSYFESDKD